MKLLTVLGTRPEMIRLSRVIPKLEQYCQQILVHTGQNYDYNLDEIFFKQLGLPTPDYHLSARGSFGEQLAKIMLGMEEIITRERPDAMLVLGDTNSSLAAIMAKRMGVRVFHMEAGNRCYDDRTPEETNRRLIDHNTDIHLPYTERSRANLLREGIPGERIFVTGNPIFEVLQHYGEEIAVASPPLEQQYRYYLATLHRAENVDVPERLRTFVEALNKLPMPVIWSVHPHTKKLLGGIDVASHVDIREPMGFFEFVGLEKHAACVLSDSGTVQEECSIFGVPLVTLRDNTERPETIETGSNFISGCDVERILRGVDLMTNREGFTIPPEYLRSNVSDVVVGVVCSAL